MSNSDTNKEIVKCLQEEFKLTMDKKNIHLKAPIKTPGIFKVDCKLGHGISCELTIDILEA